MPESQYTPVGAYIHIPFCTHKCDFCDFAAFAGLSHLEDQYTTIVQEEIRARLNGRDESLRLASVFYGGGTPGLISHKNLQAIHDCLTSLVETTAQTEVSLETTPHAITAEKAAAWQALGVNRLSIGVETFHDTELRAIGRDHTRAQALAGLETAIRLGFCNIAVDFMYGLPTQTLASWKETLSLFFQYAENNQAVNHFSAYGLHLATQSPLYFRFPKDSKEYPDEVLFEQMYFTLVEMADENGFLQYEISNFCRPGYQSHHNLSYWNNSPYLGFGVSAHRYVEGVRSSNWRSLSRYMNDFLGDETREVIDRETRAREAIMLGLRKREGIDLTSFADDYGFDLAQKFEKQLARLTDNGLVEISSNRLRITTRGVPVSNSIIAELF